jgi:ribosome-binding factor A
MKTHRLARIAEVIREVASETILFEMRDPRIRMTTVTRAEVSADLQNAKVYVSVMGTEPQQQRTLQALQHAAGFIQSKLADRLQTRFLPILRFVLDPGVKNSLEITRLINEALGTPSADEAEPGETPSTEASPDEAMPNEATDGSEPDSAEEPRA